MVPRAVSVAPGRWELPGFLNEEGTAAPLGLIQLQASGNSCPRGRASRLLQGSGGGLLSGTTLLLSSGGGVCAAWQRRTGEPAAAFPRSTVRAGLHVARRAGSESGGPCFTGREPGPQMELGRAVSSGADRFELEALVRMPGYGPQPYSVRGRKGDWESSPEKWPSGSGPESPWESR